MSLRRGSTNYEVDRDCALKDSTGRAWIFAKGESLPAWVPPEDAEALVQAGSVSKFGVI